MEKSNTKKTMNVCVFGAASAEIDEVYMQEACAIGRMLAANGIHVIFGAGGTGVMGALAKGVFTEHGSITGILPEKLNKPGVVSEYCNEVIVTKSMHERKSLMESKADAYIALAGGFGTLEELLEVIVQKQLGYFDCPICIVNTNGYYTGLAEMFEHIIAAGFANSACGDLYAFFDNGINAVDSIIDCFGIGE